MTQERVEIEIHCIVGRQSSKTRLCLAISKIMSSPESPDSFIAQLNLVDSFASFIQYIQ